MKKIISVILLISILSCKQEKKQISIAAASSLKDALDSVIIKIEKETHQKIIANYAGSQLLLSQIRSGGDFDIFISASEEQSNALLSEHKISHDQIKSFLANKLVLVSSEKMKVLDWKNHPENYMWSLGGKSVPVGFYSEQVLENMKLEIPKEKIIYSENVRQVLEIVRKQEADFAIIYQTDFLQFKNELTQVEVFSDSLHQKIIYPAIILNTNSTEVRKIYELIADSSQDIFVHYGFSSN